MGKLILLIFIPIAVYTAAAPRPNGRPTTHLDIPRLVNAIALVESGGKNLPPRWDVNGMAWGLFQFHVDRWCEIGGTRSNWGKAGPELQRRLLRQELERRNFKTFERVSRWHNGAGAAHYAHAKKLENAYKRQ